MTPASTLPAMPRPCMPRALRGDTTRSDAAPVVTARVVWGGLLIAAALSSGPSCSDAPIAPPDASPLVEPADLPPPPPKRAGPSNPLEDLPYDQNEFPVESPYDDRKPRTLTITASSQSGRAPLFVAFFAGTLDGGIPPPGLSWDFGDGASAAGPRAQHTYQDPGLYPVRLCPGATTPSPEDVTCVAMLISVSGAAASAPAAGTDAAPPPPRTLQITASRWTGPAPFLIAFAASVVEGGAMPGGLIWDFGNGATAAGLRVSHTFEAPGTYTVRLCPGPTTPHPDTLTCAEGVVIITGQTLTVDGVADSPDGSDDGG